MKISQLTYSDEFLRDGNAYKFLEIPFRSAMLWVSNREFRLHLDLSTNIGEYVVNYANPMK